MGTASYIQGDFPDLQTPSGNPLKFRHRNDSQVQANHEALRIEIRNQIARSKHFGATARNSERPQNIYDAINVTATDIKNVKSATSQSASSTGHINGIYVAVSKFPSVSVLWSITALYLHKFVKYIERLVWFADADLVDVIDAGDPRIAATKAFLSGVQAFSILTDNELAQLVGLSELRTYKAGDIVLANEATADGLNIILTGKAGRFSTSIASQPNLPDELPSDILDYQQCFGTIISPTEACATDRLESAIIALSDLLEIVWIPELIIRMLNIQPRMEYEYVLILKNDRFSMANECNMAQHEKMLWHLLRAGLHVTIMANTRNTTNSIILLLSAPLWLLAREHQLLYMERIIENHAEEDTHKHDSDDYEDYMEKLTASERIAAFASLLTRPSTDKPPGVGLRGIDPNLDPNIIDVFPLHDPSMTDFILGAWFKENNPSVAAKRLFLVRMKDYFGLRIAFFTAFVRLYNAALVYPMIIGVLLWIFWRWIDYRTYVQALGLYGLGIAFIWAPSLMKRWSRYQNSLLVEWNLLGTKQVAHQNPKFRDYIIEKIEVSGDADSSKGQKDYVEVKTYNAMRRWPKYFIFGIFCGVCLILLFLFVGFYVQWYIIAVMTPTCEDPRCPVYVNSAPMGCEKQCLTLFADESKRNYLFMSRITSCVGYCNPTTFDPAYYRCDDPLVGCFDSERGFVGTYRWLYILIQGIVLGLTLDILFLTIFESTAQWFNEWENYPTDIQVETRTIYKVFLFNWVGYFYWFFLLAFVYVPNGARVQELIRIYVDQSWWLKDSEIKFSRYWIDGLIAMDSAFVTPMIVTQALNLILNTFVPFLLRRAIVKARDSYHVRKDQWAATLKRGKANGMFGTSKLLVPAALKPTLEITTENRPPSIDKVNDNASQSQMPDKELAIDNSDIDNCEVVQSNTDIDQWIPITDSADHKQVHEMLASRDPIEASELEAAVNALFGDLSFHENHMQDICGDIVKEDLDPYQLTSYEWIDIITKRMEESGNKISMQYRNPYLVEDYYSHEPPSTSSYLSSSILSKGSRLSVVKTNNLKVRSKNYYSGLHQSQLEKSAASITETIATGRNKHWKTSHIHFITHWQCRNYICTADRILDESLMPTYTPFHDLLHLAIQFSYTVMFSVVWPFCCLCSHTRNNIALRFDAIKLTIDCKRTVPQWIVGIGAWRDTFAFEILIAQMVVPALFVYVSGQLDAFTRTCDVSEETYGPDRYCSELPAVMRLLIFCLLENGGLAICFLVYLGKNEISKSTSLKIVAHSRRLRHSLRKSVQTVGESILVKQKSPTLASAAYSLLGSRHLAAQRAHRSTYIAGNVASNIYPNPIHQMHNDRNLHHNLFQAFDLEQFAVDTPGPQFPIMSQACHTYVDSNNRQTDYGLPSPRLQLSTESVDMTTQWREGVVSWVKKGRLKVNFSGGRALCGEAQLSEFKEHDVTLGVNDEFVIIEPIPVRTFELGAQVLLASKKFGRWVEAKITHLDSKDRLGNEVAPSLNELHIRFIRAHDLRNSPGVLFRQSQLDPYCVLTIGSTICYATAAKYRTAHPLWDELAITPLLEQNVYPITQKKVGTSQSVKSAAASTSQGVSEGIISNFHKPVLISNGLFDPIYIKQNVTSLATPTNSNKDYIMTAAIGEKSTLKSSTRKLEESTPCIIETQMHKVNENSDKNLVHSPPEQQSIQYIVDESCTQAEKTPVISKSTKEVNVTTNHNESTPLNSALTKTFTITVQNNDPFALTECIGEIEIDLHGFRDGRKHRVFIPLSQKRHIWTIDAIESLMINQVSQSSNSQPSAILNANHSEYPLNGMPHILLEIQWIDSRLPTKVGVTINGQPNKELILSRKYCETNLCVGIQKNQIQTSAMYNSM